MKHGPDTVQVSADTRATPLGYLSAESGNESLDIPPGDIRPFRFFNDPVEGPLVLSIHPVTIVSRHSIISSNEFCSFISPNASLTGARPRAYRAEGCWPLFYFFAKYLTLSRPLKSSSCVQSVASCSRVAARMILSAIGSECLRLSVAADMARCGVRSTS